MVTLREGTRDGFVETPLGRVHYVSAGSGSPLVLMHGGFGSWVHWHENLAALAQQHTVFAIDMPGFGLSCDAAPGSDIGQLALAVRDAIAAMRRTLPEPLQQQPPGIAAFSFGTAVAVKLALLDPQAVGSLLLINPPGLGQVSEQVKSIQARAAEAARAQGLRAGLDITLRELMVHDAALATPAALDLLEEAVRQTRFVSRSLSRSVHLRPMIEELRMPVHVALGEDDPHQKHELQARLDWLELTLGPSSVSRFAATAHWLQYEQSARFNALALRTFRHTT
jgi:pimeloyl-ACP methyl ester carboxylesterase